MLGKIETYEEALYLLSTRTNTKLSEIFKRMEDSGRSEKSICYAISMAIDKLLAYKQDSRFYSILENEIKKYAWTKTDPRWKNYNNRKLAV